jgi:hypothetical protein
MSETKIIDLKSYVLSHTSYISVAILAIRVKREGKRFKNLLNFSHISFHKVYK